MTESNPPSLAPQGRSRRSRRGQSLVEFALVAPIVILVLLGTVDLGRVFFSWIEMQNAAREGASYAMTNPTDLVGITLRADQETNAQKQQGENGLTISVVCHNSATNAVVACNSAPVAGLGTTVTVKASQPFTFFTPLINGLFPGFGMSASATGFYASPIDGVAGGTPTPSPSPSPSPSATPTLPPGPTPTPTPTPTPSPTPSSCVVPDFYHVKGGSALGLWQGAGFQPANLTNNVPGNSKINSQSLGALTSQPCLTAKIILN